MLSMILLVYFMPVVVLIYLITTVYYYQKGRFCRKSFTYKYLMIAMLVPIAGMALITFEYWINMTHGGIHVGTWLSVLFVYAFIAIIFAIPFLLYLITPNKQP
ncbi:MULTISPECIES: hypothetical protein [unclassified Psychrobacter]|uniref:hypothetical protein n=1 Tax=unclassified Psychrobacter TaxID=196806 RepID=UPI003F471C68